MRIHFLPFRYLAEHTESVVLYSKAPFLEQITFFSPSGLHTSLPSIDGIDLYTEIHFGFLFKPSF